jgi:hypothetical protein
MTSDENQKIATDTVAFFSNKSKKERERWVIDEWLKAQKKFPGIVADGDEPPDFNVDGRSIEVVEALHPSRKRDAEYKDELKKVQNSRESAPGFWGNQGSIEYIKRKWPFMDYLWK